jgi:transposase-like protein
MKKRFTDEQVIRILREAESRDEPVKDLCKRHNISEQTFYRWRNKFGGMDVADASAQGAGIGERSAQAPNRRADAGNRTA